MVLEKGPQEGNRETWMLEMGSGQCDINCPTLRWDEAMCSRAPTAAAMLNLVCSLFLRPTTQNL